MTGVRMCCRSPYRARWCRWLRCVRSKGADPLVRHLAESTDLCRRICLGGGRVVVVPQARIAHRRALIRRIRSKNGRPCGDERRSHRSVSCRTRGECLNTRTLDMHRSWWPLLWLHPSSSSRWDWPCFAWRANSRIMHAASWRCRGVRWLRLRVLSAHARLRRQSKVGLNRYPRCLRIIGRSGNGSTVAVRCATRGMSCCSVLLRRTICVNGCCVDGDWPRRGADCRHMDSRAVLGRASFRMFRCVDVFRTAVAHGRELHPVASYRDHVMVVCLRHGHQCA